MARLALNMGGRQLIRRIMIVSTLALLPISAIAATLPAPGSFESFRDAGEKAFAQNNYGQAEKNFISALKALETAGLPNSDLRWAQAYKNLASLYDVRSQFPKCELYLERELRAREKALGSEHPQVIAAVGKLCRFYLQHNNQAKADRLSGLLLNYGERIQKTEQQVDTHFAELHKYFSTHSEFAETEKKLKSARESADKIRADDHLELAASLDSIATIYKERSKYQLAENLYKRSLELREKTLAPGHQALAFAYENLGSLYQTQGKQQLAQPFFQKSLEITNKSLDFKRPEVFGRLDSLARTYISLGQNSQAETLYKQALTLIKDNCGARHRDYGAASNSLATLYIKQGRYSEAEPLLKTAVSICEGINGPYSISLVPLLDAYAESLEKCSKGSEAAKVKHRANSIRGNSSACNSTGETAADF